MNVSRQTESLVSGTLCCSYSFSQFLHLYGAYWSVAKCIDLHNSDGISRQGIWLGLLKRYLVYQVKKGVHWSRDYSHCGKSLSSILKLAKKGTWIKSNMFVHEFREQNPIHQTDIFLSLIIKEYVVLLCSMHSSMLSCMSCSWYLSISGLVVAIFVAISPTSGNTQRYSH
jgi:hypothetical protein